MDDYLRAFDITNGDELWRGRLPAGGQATPMSYEVVDPDGGRRQFVVIAAGGHARAGSRLGDSLVAFALPAEWSRLTPWTGSRSLRERLEPQCCDPMLAR
jgi:quinoprotein glucose dehydrogenase